MLRLNSTMAGIAVSTFGLAVVLTNSLRTVDWLHPVHINILGFVLLGVGGVMRLVGRRPHTSRD